MPVETEVGIPASVVNGYKEKFDADSKNCLARNVCTKNNPLDVLKKRETIEKSQHVFTHKVEAEGKPVSNQRSSGRCWIFACLNCMRLPFVKFHNVEEFEFSQNQIFFWDKLERFNYLLHAFVKTAREPADGRLVQHLLMTPSEDGGQWSMLVNLIEKYGVMPKVCFPDAWSSENSRQFDLITNNKMREYCMRLRSLVEDNTKEEEIQKEIEKMGDELYRIISICLGTPPDTFTWEYQDKDKNYHSLGPITPLQFYREHVKPHFNMEDKVVLTNDPRPSNVYGKLYTVDYLGNMVGGRLVTYINQPIEVLKKLAQDSIKNNQTVWFGCDVGKHCSWKKNGIEDTTMYDYELVFGTSILNMNKADRLLYRESLMTHAMVLTAVSEQDGKTTKWRIENSWGDTDGNKGYMLMTDQWFSEFVFEIVVDKKFVPADIIDILDQKPIILPAWDPMGALAKSHL